MLVANFSWPVIFLINIPIGLIGFYLASKFLPSQLLNSEEEKFDVCGTVIFALAAVITIISLVMDKGINVKFFALGIVLFALFYLFERKTAYPMLDFGLFKIKNFVFGNLMGLAAYCIQPFVMFLMPFHLERLLHLSPAFSGLIMTIPPICMAFTAPLAGTLSDKIGPFRLTSASFILMTVSLLIFSTLNQDINIFKIAGGLIILGIGMGAFGSPNNNSILGSIPKEKAGYTGGFISTVRNFSFSLGTAFSVSIFTFLLNMYQQTNSFYIAYAKATTFVYCTAAGITLLGFILSLVTGCNRKTIEPSPTSNF